MQHQPTARATFDGPIRTRRRVRDDEPTLKMELAPATLTPDDKVLVGYLILEENEQFERLSHDEQRQVLETLRR
jgi:hypothetical protein